MHKFAGGNEEKLPFADSRFDVICRKVFSERSVKDKAYAAKF